MSENESQLQALRESVLQLMNLLEDAIVPHSIRAVAFAQRLAAIRAVLEEAGKQ